MKIKTPKDQTAGKAPAPKRGVGRVTKSSPSRATKVKTVRANFKAGKDI